MSRHQRLGSFARRKLQFALENVLDQRVFALLDQAGMMAGGTELNDLIRRSHTAVESLAVEAMRYTSVAGLFEHDAYFALNLDATARNALVARSIRRVHRLALAQQYERV